MRAAPITGGRIARTISALNTQPARSVAASEPLPGSEYRKGEQQALGEVGAQAPARSATDVVAAMRRPSLITSMSLHRITVEVDHVAGLARRGGAVTERDAEIGLGQGRRIVGAVAAHADPPALGLLARAAACSLSSGLASATNSSTPASAATVAAVSRLSPVTMTVRTPMRRSSSHCARMPGRTTS